MWAFARNLKSEGQICFLCPKQQKKMEAKDCIYCIRVKRILYYGNFATVFLFSLPVYLLFSPAYSKDTFYCTVPYCAVNSKPMSNRVEKYCIPITVVLNAAFYWEWHVIRLNIHNMTHFRQKHKVVYWTISLQYSSVTRLISSSHFPLDGTTFRAYNAA